jgi:hypothetical protein
VVGHGRPLPEERCSITRAHRPVRCGAETRLRRPLYRRVHGHFGVSGSGGVNECGAAPTAREGHVALSPCRLRLSGKRGGEMPSRGGHATAVRSPSGTSVGVRGERVSGQRLGVGVTRLLSCSEAIGMAPLSRQCGDGGLVATSTRRTTHEEELGSSLDGRACMRPGRAACRRAPVPGISAV